MMQIANIYPIANQSHYKHEKYVMILAHLLDKYDPKYFNKDQYIIMDNGLFEKQQVSTKLEDLINLAESSEIPINEIIIPDAFNDKNKTIELFESNIDTIKKWQHKYRFMFVAQCANYAEFVQIILYINRYTDELNLSIGVPKCVPFDRTCQLAINGMQSKFPIHFLGLKETFAELDPVKDIIRGVDTSQIAFMAKNTLSINVLDYKRKGEAIDLDKDCCEDFKLNELRTILQQAYR